MIFSFRNVMSAVNGDDRAEWVYNEQNFEVNYSTKSKDISIEMNHGKR